MKTPDTHPPALEIELNGVGIITKTRVGRFFFEFARSDNCYLDRLDDEFDRAFVRVLERCAWLDEWQRRISAAECSKYKTVNGVLVDAECYDNAAAWSVWGVE